MSDNGELEDKPPAPPVRMSSTIFSTGGKDPLSANHSLKPLPSVPEEKKPRNKIISIFSSTEKGKQLLWFQESQLLCFGFDVFLIKYNQLISFMVQMINIQLMVVNGHYQEGQFGTSLEVQWLGLCTFTAEGQVHLAGELRFCKPRCALKKRKRGQFILNCNRKE